MLAASGAEPAVEASHTTTRASGRPNHSEANQQRRQGVKETTHQTPDAILVIGLGIAALAAAATTVVLRAFGRIDSGIDLADTALGPSLTEVGPGTVLVALAAGMAGMLAYETAVGAAVGVAISVTTIPAAAYVGCALGLGTDTIPAAAYVGCALGLGTDTSAGGALEVLATNVLCIVAGSAVTLAVQRRGRSDGSSDHSARR